MSETAQSKLRDAIEFMKNDSGSGTKARKQERFRQVYEPAVAHLITGERYDDAGVGPVTAEKAVDGVFPDLQVADFPTITEAVASLDTDGEQSLDSLVSDLDSVARRSGNSQREYIRECLKRHAEPSLVTLALLDDESIGLGTSQMREAFFDGTRDERKRAEAFVPTTQEFIQLAQKGTLPTVPTVGVPFAPMRAVPESRGQPDNPVCQKKIDGYRIVIHVKQEEIGPKAYAFTRQQNDEIQSLPELNEMDWPKRGEYIIDAEVIAETGSYSDTSSRVGRDAGNVNRDITMHFDVFDCIVYQGDDISQSDFEDRFNMAMEFVNAVDDERLNIVPVKDDIKKAKDDALEAGDEGIIVKDNRGPYEFGKRSTYWQKQKYDSDNLDLNICGFHEGDGEGSGTLGAVEIETADGVYVGRSGSGFTNEQRDEIWSNQDEWFGRTIEIEARGISPDENKLRMPIFVRDRSADGTPDSLKRVKELMKEI